MISPRNARIHFTYGQQGEVAGFIMNRHWSQLSKGMRAVVANTVRRLFNAKAELIGGA